MANSSNDEQLFGDWPGDDEPSEEQHEPTPEQISDARAEGLREASGMSHFFAVAQNSLSKSIDLGACQKFREDLLRDCGNPSDPVEIMLIEQLALANFHVGRLFTRSALAPTAPLSIAFVQAATRLQAEFRRCALALEEYREKQIDRKTSTTSSVTTTEPPPEEESEPTPATEKKEPAVDELDSNNGRINGNGNGHINRIKPFVEESAKGRSRKAKSGEARSAVNGSA